MPVLADIQPHRRAQPDFLLDKFGRQSLAEIPRAAFRGLGKLRPQNLRSDVEA
jgi:hypothetical protein